jgi:hypothetical protein
MKAVEYIKRTNALFVDLDRIHEGHGNPPLDECERIAKEMKELGKGVPSLGEITDALNDGAVPPRIQAIHLQNSTTWAIERLMPVIMEVIIRKKAAGE